MHPVTKGGGRQIPRREEASVPPRLPGTRRAPRSQHRGAPCWPPLPWSGSWAGGGDPELRTWTPASEFRELQLLAQRGIPVLEYPASSESFSRQPSRTPGSLWPRPTARLPHPGSLRRCWSSARTRCIWDPVGEAAGKLAGQSLGNSLAVSPSQLSGFEAAVWEGWETGDRRS